MQDTYLEATSAILKTMGHPIRLKVLYLLLEGECSTGELLAQLQTSHPNLSQHLNILRAQGLVTSKRDHTFIRNSITDKRIRKMLIDLRSFFQPEQTNSK
ncbi:ArsR/SmtB family transcription factor [Desulfotalea psychrophila]|nr:metalloregulator ArsR/SmtB family transcription factor [Desulfotalea psychrophila]